MDPDETWHGGRFYASAFAKFVKCGPNSPIFGYVCCGQVVEWIKMQLGKRGSLGQGHIVLDGDPAPLPQRGTASPQFVAHVCCGQTVGWIKVPLGREVGLGPGHIVLDGDTPPPPPKGYSPQFLAHVYCGETVAHHSYCYEHLLNFHIS